MLSEETIGHIQGDGWKSDTAFKIVVAGDDISTAGLRALLSAEEDLEVVAIAPDPKEALRYVSGHKPSVLLIDAMEPGTIDAGIGMLKDIEERSPETEVVLLTHMHDPLKARDALRAGINGYVLKQDDPGQLLRALREAADGNPYLSPKVAVALAQMSSKSGVEELSDREVEVLRLVGLGHTNAEISELLHLSVRTIESHRAHIQTKLDVHTRAGLVRMALDRGLIN